MCRIQGTSNLHISCRWCSLLLADLLMYIDFLICNSNPSVPLRKSEYFHLPFISPVVFFFVAL